MAEKSHDLSSASWKPRKSGGVMTPSSESWWCGSSQNLKAGEAGAPMVVFQFKSKRSMTKDISQAERESIFLHLFILLTSQGIDAHPHQGGPTA